MRPRSSRGVGWIVVAAVAACAPDLSEQLGDDDDGPGGPPPTVDASNGVDWVGFDLDLGEAVDIGDPGWDLQFKRVEVLMNDGVEAAVLDGVDYDGLTEAPADGYSVDTDEEAVFVAWYDYDYVTHILTPADRVYVVHTTEDAYVKVRFVDYYDQGGTSGMYTFDHAPIDPPGSR